MEPQHLHCQQIVVMLAVLMEKNASRKWTKTHRTMSVYVPLGLNVMLIQDTASHCQHLVSMSLCIINGLVVI